MCESCGCGSHGAETIVVRENLLAANDRVAAHVRKHFDAHRVLAINLMSSPGAGKTSLLEATIAALPPGVRVAVIEGDLETENDAERIRRHGVKAVQITTGVACHLDATMVHDALDEISLDDVDILFIENVGNLVCPADFDIGQHRNVVLLSVTEGDDKPEKYPVIFRNADLVLITKTDLLPYLDDFDTGARAGRRRKAARRRAGEGSVRQDDAGPRGLDGLARRRARRPSPPTSGGGRLNVLNPSRRRARDSMTALLFRPSAARDGRRGRNGRRRRRAAAARRSVRPRDHLRPAVGDRSLQFPLRLLHGGEDDVPAARRGAAARGTGSAVLDLRRPRGEEDQADRRRAAGAARRDEFGPVAVAPPARARARRADADDQRLAAGAIRRRARRLRRQAGECFVGYARRGDVRGDLAARRALRRAGRHRSRRSRRAQGQDQRGGAERPHRRLRGSLDPLGAWSRLRPHLHRGDAARRRRGRVVAAVHVAGRVARQLGRASDRCCRRPIAAAARRATGRSKRRAGASASSRR